MFGEIAPKIRNFFTTGSGLFYDLPNKTFIQSNTGLVYGSIKSTTVGASNEAGLILNRGDQTNGYAQIHYENANTDTWATGLRSGESKFYIRDVVNSVNTLAITTGSIPNWQITGLFNSTSTTVGSIAYNVFSNSDNTNAASNVMVQSVVGGASAGDPTFGLTVSGATDWFIGLDNSVNDQLCIGTGQTPGSNNWLTITTSGVVNIPNLTASSLVATDSSKNLTSTTTSLTPQFSTLGLGATAAAATITSQLNIFSATQNSSRIVLSGQEFFQASNTSAEGVGLLIGVNRSTNRQLWIIDTALSAVSASNPVLRLAPGGGSGGAIVDCLATDGSTILPLKVGNSGALLNLSGTSVTSSAVLYPTVDNSFTLGKSGNRWSQLWAGTTTINTSDASTKNSIEKTRLGLDFIKKLQPREFKFNERNRLHHGLVAQEVKKVLDDLKIDSNDFAGYVDPSVEDINDKSACGLRYSEFIAPLILAVQELSEKINK